MPRCNLHFILYCYYYYYNYFIFCCNVFASMLNVLICLRWDSHCSHVTLSSLWCFSRKTFFDKWALSWNFFEQRSSEQSTFWMWSSIYCAKARHELKMGGRKLKPKPSIDRERWNDIDVQSSPGKALPWTQQQHYTCAFKITLNRRTSLIISLK